MYAEECNDYLHVQIFDYSNSFFNFSPMMLTHLKETKMEVQIRPVINHLNVWSGINIALTMQKMIPRHQSTFLAFSKDI